MSLDLTLLPLETYTPEHSVSLTVLSLTTNSRSLMAAILKLTKEKSQSIEFITDEKITDTLKGKVGCYLARNKHGEAHYARTNLDSYGEPLKWVLVSAIMSLKDHPDVLKSSLNKSVWGYLTACPPNQKVILYWH